MTMHEDALCKAAAGMTSLAGNRARFLGRFAGMTAFRYQAVELNGAPVKGVIEAEDRKAALQLLGGRGLFHRSKVLEANASADRCPRQPRRRAAGRVKRKDITAFTREMGALLGAAIPIPQALEGLGEEEENPALRRRF